SSVKCKDYVNVFLGRYTSCQRFGFFHNAGCACLHDFPPVVSCKNIRMYKMTKAARRNFTAKSRSAFVIPLSCECYCGKYILKALSDITGPRSSDRAGPESVSLGILRRNELRQ